LKAPTNNDEACKEERKGKKREEKDIVEEGNKRQIAFFGTT